jgi:hypothetical protein
MPPFIPAINYAFAPIAENTGLAGFVPVDASGISGSSTFDNGLSTNQKFNEPNFNTVSTTPSTPGAAQKTPLVDFKFEANRLLGEDNINKYLNGFNNPNSDKNIVFQEFVNKVVGQSFQTPGAINPQMRDIMEKYQVPLANAANDMNRNPNDRNHVYNFHRWLIKMGSDLKPGVVPVQADAVPVQPDAVPVQADAVPVQAVAVPVQADAVPVQADASNPWWKLWGGRKTARNHKRSHKRNHKRSRSRKQYKKLKRSSRNRRRC